MFSHLVHVCDAGTLVRIRVDTTVNQITKLKREEEEEEEEK